MRRVVVLVAALAVVLAGCSDDGGDPESDGKAPAADATTATTTAGTAATAAAPKTVAPTTAATAGPGGTAAPTTGSARPELRTDGIGVTRLGSGEAAVVAALTRAFGPPDLDHRFDPDDCGPGADRIVRWRDLSIWFGDEADERVFYGWALAPSSPGEPASPALATPEGLGVGATGAALRTAYGSRLTIVPGSAGAGATFKLADAQGNATSFSGRLTGSGNAQTVAAFSGGLVCETAG